MGQVRKKYRRRYGEHLVRAMRVRLPPEVDSALRQARKLFGIPIAEMVRAGTERALVDQVPDVLCIGSG